MDLLAVTGQELDDDLNIRRGESATAVVLMSIPALFRWRGAVQRVAELVLFGGLVSGAIGLKRVGLRSDTNWTRRRSRTGSAAGQFEALGGHESRAQREEGHP